MRYHLLHEPPIGGMPIILSDPIKKAKKVSGIVRPSPSIWEISVLWLAIMIAPAQKNSVILPIACMAICMPLPITPRPLAKATPRIMYDSWLTVE